MNKITTLALGDIIIQKKLTITEDMLYNFFDKLTDEDNPLYQYGVNTDGCTLYSNDIMAKILKNEPCYFKIKDITYQFTGKSLLQAFQVFYPRHFGTVDATDFRTWEHAEVWCCFQYAFAGTVIYDHDTKFIDGSEHHLHECPVCGVTYYRYNQQKAMACDVCQSKDKV